ncbi:hypothetical protein K503DRAFT_859487 [Rhizopogon vinicolor AM-OR11-026]|uniref:F-box domain-containing protein n=1 Tax=Rhizopogon vinicolor AM-OR11-026 TaxID=1314800 RepID=A0A1B7MMZ3_9AGAM|nr:hypothetical protein K503DRAFT_859487 [Rhizopogon vinicolor AM-OR11-026]
MHRALFVSEVLLEVFSHLNPFQSSSWDERLSRKSFAVLAWTCKAFHEPAMDLLTQRSVRRSWRSEGIEPLSEHEARQLLRHAARVQSLHISTDGHFHLLTVLPFQKCLFPRLLALDWEHAGNTRRLHLFLSPMLRRCTLSAVHSDLKSIATCCPVLESLSIGTFGVPTADELSLLSDTVRSCKQLVDLNCPYLDFAAWKYLSHLPTILAVKINDGISHHPLNRDDLYCARFLNLTTLIFDVGSCADVITVMQHSEFPSLKEFQMYANVLPWAKAEQLCHALSLCKACDTLERIEIFSCNSDHSPEPLTVVKRFLCFRQLQVLSLTVNYDIGLDNDLLLEAMSNWPHIRRLELNNPCFMVAPPTVTFRGLFAALRKCPDLHTLQVSIDAVNIDIDATVESFRHTSLQSLDLSYSDIANPKAVARIILSMLPGVDGIGYNDFADPDEPTPWHEVDSLLLEFRNAQAAPTT